MNHAGVPTGRRHVPALDGLRGLAILLVLSVHLFSEDPYGRPPLSWAYHLCKVGWVGVDLFFVLSGYLITGVLLDARGRPGYFRSFYARRALRTFPLYFGLLGVAAVVTALSAAHPTSTGPAADDFRHAQGWLWTYTSNIPAARRGRFVPFNVGPMQFGQFWSLAIEEQFYLVWPVVVLACPRRWLAALTVTAAAASAIGRTAYVWRADWGPVAALTAYVGTPFRVDGLLIGAAAVMLTRSPAASGFLRWCAWPLVLGAAAVMVGVQARVGWTIASKFVAAQGYTLLAMGFAALLIACVVADPAHPVRRLAEQRWLRLAGQYSYGIYATHLMVIAAVVGPVTNALRPWLRHDVPADLIARLAAGCAAVAVAAVSWHLYEMPFIRLKRFVPRPAAPAIGVEEADR